LSVLTLKVLATKLRIKLLNSFFITKNIVGIGTMLMPILVDQFQIFSILLTAKNVMKQEEKKGTLTNCGRRIFG
jgi:hypothetical protein